MVAYNITEDGTPMSGVWTAATRTVNGFTDSGGGSENVAIGGNWVPPAGRVYTFRVNLAVALQFVEIYDGAAWVQTDAGVADLGFFTWYQQDDTPADGTLRFNVGGGAAALLTVFYTYREVGI